MLFCCSGIVVLLLPCCCFAVADYSWQTCIVLSEPSFWLRKTGFAAEDFRSEDEGLMWVQSRKIQKNGEHFAI